MVAATDALNSPVEAGEPIRAKMRVHAYMHTSNTAPARARIRFAFFHDDQILSLPYSIPKNLVYGKQKLVYNNHRWIFKIKEQYTMSEKKFVGPVARYGV